ncbi:M14 family zinc carboxypeptidase [Ascidiimonas aurantiaca]|uniref:M14 family zinc carboxypeptidase n=1 Tax=Ascidiimonas aurantiaca TaxID=1685432 RepID=UPI0030EB8973
MATKKGFLYGIASLCFTLAYAQDFEEDLYNSYDRFKEKSLTERRFKHVDLQPLIENLSGHDLIDKSTVGYSIEGRKLSLLSMGSGTVDVFLWSQMHGDEPTATAAVFDILNYFTDTQKDARKTRMLENLRIHFLPMLNPDGAEVYKRRNTLGIDVNRDALRLQSPEGRTLKRVRDSLEADFGFNLHDQSIHYNTSRTANTATVSFLAPAYNYEKSVNKVRGDAMKIIVHMNEVLQRYIPGKVGRYNDDFEPRAFGDNIQKWGTSTILIESGGYPGDIEKQYIRKLNFVSILSALDAIASGDYSQKPLPAYEDIPHNDRKLFDLKLTGFTYPIQDKTYILDIGIHHSETQDTETQKLYYNGRVSDQGDLSTFFGYKEKDMNGYTYVPAKVYPEKLADMGALGKLDIKSLLQKGYAYLKIENVPEDQVFTDFPMHLVPDGFEPSSLLNPGVNATFFLAKNNSIHYAVINGFLIDVNNVESNNGNGLIIR